MNDLPLVSILTTVYNREKYLTDCINSILNINYSNWELIIVDDCSKDNSYQIAGTFAKKDKRIKIFQNENNLGDYPNRNKAASYAKGKYIKYLDADDTIYKYSLDYMVEAMEKNPTAALGISFNTIDDKWPYPQLCEPNITIKSEYLGKSLLGCGPSASIIKRDVFIDMNGFSGKQYIGDHELWLKLACVFPIVKLQPSLIWWRVHDEQQIASEEKNIKIRNVRFQLSKSHLIANKSFFSPDEYTLAECRLKQNYARGLLKQLLTNKKWKDFYLLFKWSNLSLAELLSGFKGYIYQ